MDKVTKRMKWKPALGALVLGAGLLAANPVSAEGLEMVVYEHSFQGKRLMHGEWEQVLEDVESGSGARFEDHTYRCISLTLARQLEAAVDACDAAVAAAEVASPRVAFDNLLQVERDKRRAMALTNRGVLRVLQGDLAGARVDFEMATDISPRVKAAAANLDLLGADSRLSQIH